MKILVTYPNWKWTGPAEHAVNFAAGLRARGHVVYFQHGRGPDGQENTVRSRALLRDLEYLDERLVLSKHFAPLGNIRDIGVLRERLRRKPIDAAIVNLNNDHQIVGEAIRGLDKKPRLLRIVYDGDGLGGRLREKMLAARYPCDFAVISDLAVKNMARIFKVPECGFLRLETPVDFDRFRIATDERRTALRRAAGIRDDEIVFGVVARVQRRRRYDVIMRGFDLAQREVPNLRLAIIGRGTRLAELTREPAAKMGITDKMIFTGYVGEGYAERIQMIDVKIYLVPGTDGSCRALREMMALGRPMITSALGMLAELNTDGVTGLVIDELRPEKLAAAMIRLARDAGLRAEMAEAARVRARERFSVGDQVGRLEKFLLAAGAREGATA